jgi:hypothetical protein
MTTHNHASLRSSADGAALAPRSEPGEVGERGVRDAIRDGVRPGSGAGPRPGREVRLDSLAARQLGARSLYPADPPPQSGTARLVGDLVTGASGFGSCLLVTHIVDHDWGHSLPLSAIIAFGTIIQRVAARRRGGASR